MTDDKEGREGIEDVEVEESILWRDKMSKNVTFCTDLKLDANDNHSDFKFDQIWPQLIKTFNHVGKTVFYSWLFGWIF